MLVPIAFTDPDAAAARGAEVITGGAAVAGAIDSDDESVAGVSDSLTATGSELATPETGSAETRFGRRPEFLMAEAGALRTALPFRDGDVPRLRDDAVDDADADAVDGEVEVVDPEPLEPAEPVVSAKAMGIDATAAPTPRATAKAPTRPI
jgi:hypothetical protein